MLNNTNPSKYTLAEVNEMLAERKAGETYQQIGDKHGCSKTHARALCMGVRGPLAPQRSIQHPRKGADTKAKALALFADGLGKEDIAAMLNISENHCATLIVKKPREKHPMKSHPFHGEREPNWSHKLAAIWLSKALV